MTGPVGIYRKAGSLAREIVAKRVTILAGTGIILGELVRAGVLPGGLSGTLATDVAVSLDILGVVTGIIWARSGTTPADPALRPTSTTGDLLVPLRETALSASFGDTPPPVITPAKPDPYMGGGDVPAGADQPIVFTPVPTDPEATP